MKLGRSLNLENPMDSHCPVPILDLDIEILIINPIDFVITRNSSNYPHSVSACEMLKHLHYTVMNDCNSLVFL